MHISCILAGTLLARLGRPEVANCIAGLKQYSYAYEEAGDQANDMSRLFNRARMGELELNHMTSVVPRVGTSSSSPRSPHGHGMLVDGQHLHRPNGTSHVRQSFYFVFPLLFSLMGTNAFSPLGTAFLLDSREFFKTIHIQTMNPQQPWASSRSDHVDADESRCLLVLLSLIYALIPLLSVVTSSRLSALVLLAIAFL